MIGTLGTPWIVWAEPLPTTDVLVAPPPRTVRIVLEMDRALALASAMEGHILRMPNRDGDPFRKGDTLVGMDCTIQQAKARKAKVRRDLAVKKLAAQKKLHKLRSGSRMAAEQAEADQASSEADMAMQRAMLEHCRVRAPWTGVVVKRLVRAHQYVRRGQPLLEILDPASLQARLIVPSRWLRWLKKGQRFSFQLDETGKQHRGEITHIGVRIDPGSQTVELRGQIRKQTPELKAGMGGVAHFEGKSP